MPVASWCGGRPPLTVWRLQLAGNRTLVDHVGPGAERAALDVGCGTGELAGHLHGRLGNTVTAIDCSPTGLLPHHFAASCSAGCPTKKPSSTASASFGPPAACSG
ncbi:class I SAM-dependent methyltransferase [Streptomyces sp. NPDC088400]|uniref:class I SAM-dependent methyltransferase n=1 Tax=Streptomyces sp. NPDC088400 TaxID=3365861 RepID=UPI00382F5154